MLEYKVKEIAASAGIKYIKENHYTKSCHNGPSPVYGLFDGENMIGVCMFATPCSEDTRASIFGKEHKDRVIELHRLHILDVTPKNTESWFVAKCLKLLSEKKPHLRACISFADSTEGHSGTIYKALNAFYYGKTNREPAWLDQEGRLRHRRQNGKHVDGVSLGWTRVYREPKYRYFWLLGDRRQKREWLPIIRVTTKNYEKPKNIEKKE